MDFMSLSKKKFLISGVKGMLGSELKNQIDALGGIVYPYDIDELDICNIKSVQSIATKHRPNFFINCSAYTAVDKCESDPIAMQVNGDAVQNIADVCHNEKIKLFHFSTDYINSGNFSEPIEETQTPNPINRYGEGKLKGDKFIIEKPGLDFLLFRVQWLYGKNGKNFVDTMIRLSKENQTLKVVSDQIGRPTSVKFLAKIVIESLENNLSGIYNAGPRNYCSWFDFASYILRDTNCKVIPISSAEYPTPAKRPLFSVLSVKKIQSALPKSKTINQTWQELLDEYFL